MTRRPLLSRAALACVAATLALLVLPGSAAFAAGIAGPKRSALDKLEEGDAIRNRRQLRGGRFELAPAAAFTINDPYQRNLLFGAQLTYHITDAWAIGVTGFGGVGVNTGLADEIETDRPEKADDFSNVGLLATLDAYYAPIIGKYAIFGRAVVHYDIHLLAGIGATKVSGGSNLDDASVAPVLGVGFRNFVNEWIAVNVEVRDYIFSQALNSVVEVDDQGADTTSSAEFSQNFALLLGVAFYFPRIPEIGD